MNTILSFISEYIYVYIWMIATTFINIVAPTSVSTIINPVTAFFTDPQRAIGIGGLLFFFTGLHRVYLFRKDILSDKKNLDMIWSMLPFTIIGAIAGGLLISYINTKLLVTLIVTVSLYYILKTIHQLIIQKKEEKRDRGLGFVLIATLSGFFQGGGMPGGDLRNNYLRTVLSEVSVRAVNSALGLVNFFIGGTIIFLHNKLTPRDVLFVLTAVPLLLLAQFYGKKYLEKLSDTRAKLCAVSLSLLGVILLTYKYLL